LALNGSVFKIKMIAKNGVLPLVKKPESSQKPMPSSSGSLKSLPFSSGLSSLCSMSSLWDSSGLLWPFTQSFC
jgi:hypothetical protein